MSIYQHDPDAPRQVLIARQRVNERMRLSVAAPTKAVPGSQEKIALLEARYCHGAPLWNPLDAKYAPPRETAQQEVARRGIVEIAVGMDDDE